MTRQNNNSIYLICIFTTIMLLNQVEFLSQPYYHSFKSLQWQIQRFFSTLTRGWIENRRQSPPHTRRWCLPYGGNWRSLLSPPLFKRFLFLRSQRFFVLKFTIVANITWFFGFSQCHLSLSPATSTSSSSRWSSRLSLITSIQRATMRCSSLHCALDPPSVHRGLIWNVE